MKRIISADFIDYIHGIYGIRVRRKSCRSILLEGAAWVEYGAEYPLPVEGRYLEIPFDQTMSMTSLACAMLRLEEAGKAKTRELRRLLSGELHFDTVR